MVAGIKRNSNRFSMKVLVDMNLSPKIATLIMESGIYSKHWYEVGLPNAKDSEIMNYARQNDYTILTCDLDFTTLLSVSKGRKPSIVQLRTQGYEAEQITELVVAALIQNANELEEGAILSIDAKQSRLRLLSLRSVDIE